MTDLLSVAAFLALPLIGISTWKLAAVRAMDLGARLAVAGAAGMAITGAVLGSLSIVGVPWSRATVVPILALIAAGGLYAVSRSARFDPVRRRYDRVAIAGIVVVLLLMVYGLLTARASSGDLHFFWGPKAIQFYHDRGVTIGYFTNEVNASQNPGYPLLLPMVYVWSLIVSKEFSWWAAVLSTALFVAASVALVRGAANDDRGALLMVSTLAYTVTIATAAGAGDPPLVFFETLALVALTFVREQRTQTVLAALGLAGAVMLKIEGAVFAAAVVLALVIVHRRVKTAAVIVAPAAVLLAAWLWFVKSNEVVEYYRGAVMPIYFEAFPIAVAELVASASYQLFWLPWIVPAILVVSGPARRAAALPAIVALATFVAAIFYYVHVPDPTWWIRSSAPRVLLTPLTALLIAAIAAHRTSDVPTGAAATDAA